MSVIVELQFSTRWTRPVHVGDDHRITGVVVGPSDALRFMSTRFSFRRGTSFLLAQRACCEAVAGKTDPEHARRLFMSAYAEDCVRRCLLAEADATLTETTSN
ncbi:DUF982 domain-containing protein [Aliirhizobium smilacinae]|uniref:DUF982 domain-containing protein n=1 Tax=Aliirhizobium smilacinae TaxID=1395944 RepID=UPI0015D619D4|nr:DUF982 domain-containing protein [Rhizobium smilacinae]